MYWDRHWAVVIKFLQKLCWASFSYSYRLQGNLSFGCMPYVFGVLNLSKVVERPGSKEEQSADPHRKSCVVSILVDVTGMLAGLNDNWPCLLKFIQAV